ncbi:hypothetical protein WJM97_03955 [Okeanomitos corallinicola TIOX110]|uniref:Uncharacterized protein n=1 Tax=Okeanomitos corallinicola TIOX110 TaxID=3133117 RepID=A0ABZ2UZ70_9CYAN
MVVDVENQWNRLAIFIPLYKHRRVRLLVGEFLTNTAIKFRNNWVFIVLDQDYTTEIETVKALHLLSKSQTYIFGKI